MVPDTLSIPTWDSYLKKCRRYTPDTFVLEQEVRDQGQQAHSDTKMMRDTLLSQDACTNYFWIVSHIM